MQTKITYIPDNATQEALAMSKINSTNNITPSIWYHRIKTKGKPDLVAISLLSEIYGQCLNLKSDIIQINYNTLNKILGLSRNQIRAALIRLESQELLSRKFKTVEIEGIVCHRMMFIEINPDEINKITTNH